MTTEDDKTHIYSLGVAVILASLLLSAAVYFSVNSLAGEIARKNFQVTVNGGTGTAGGTGAQNAGQQAAPSPSAAPSAAAGEQQRVNVDMSGRPSRGAADAKLTIVEFSDFECPYCGAAQPTIAQIEKDYAGKVKVVFMHFPLPFHPNAQKAGEAAECALDQGKFWELHDKMFANQQALGVAQLKAYAKDLGMNTTKFDACLDSGVKAAQVGTDQSKGQAAGVGGTPTFFINGLPVVGALPYAQFKQVLDAELAK